MRDFPVHFQMTLKKWNNWCPGKDYGRVRDGTEIWDILSKTGWVAILFDNDFPRYSVKCYSVSSEMNKPTARLTDLKYIDVCSHFGKIV